MTGDFDEVVGFIAQPAELILSVADRTSVYHTFMHWFAATQKRSVPDLEPKIVTFQKRMADLALGVRFKYDSVGNGNLVAEADGVNAETLAQMKAGTLWFDGWPNLEYEVMCVIAE